MAKLLVLVALIAACARTTQLEPVLGDHARAAAEPGLQLGRPLPTPGARSSGTSASTAGIAQAAIEGTAAQASGAGAIAVGRFGDNPAAPLGFPAAGFFSVAAAPDSAFGLVTVLRCQVTGGLVYWWDGLVWRLVSQQAFDREAGCVTVGITGSTEPSLAQIADPGIAFALGESPRVKAVDP